MAVLFLPYFTWGFSAQPWLWWWVVVVIAVVLVVVAAVVVAPPPFPFHSKGAQGCKSSHRRTWLSVRRGPGCAGVLDRLLFTLVVLTMTVGLL